MGRLDEMIVSLYVGGLTVRGTGRSGHGDCRRPRVTTLGWADWHNIEHLGGILPAEFDNAFSAVGDVRGPPAGVKRRESPSNQGRFSSAT